MGRLHLRNIVFPAVLLSCSIFSTLTLPFVLSDPNPLTLKLPPVFEGEIQSVFRSENKTLAIRYIGAAILLSVGAGLVTIELLRRLSSDATELAREPWLPMDEPEDPEFDLEFDPESDAIAAELSSIKPPALVGAVATPAMTALQADRSTLDFVAPHSSESNAAILVLDEHRDTCRIKTSGPDQTAFALMWNGEYYRFFRVRHTQDKALAIAKALVHRGEQVVVSHLEQGYAVWVREPGASAEWVS
jgi:hypothetical protein